MKIKIRGKKRLQGTVKVSGAKNSAVACIPAIVLCDEEVILRNIPDIEDVRTLITILDQLGYAVSFKNNVLRVKKFIKPSYKVTSSEVNKLRGSYYFMGSFLGRYKKIIISHSGGCDLGHRPINFHLNGFKSMNVKIKDYPDYMCLKTRKLIGADINLEFPSVGATINLMIASVLAKGTTIINNAAIEPEVSDVANFLVSMGAVIEGIDTSKLIITGVKSLHSTDYTIISDRIEAGTYLILGALSTGEGITVLNVNPAHMEALTKVLKDTGCDIVTSTNKISIKRDLNKPLNTIHLEDGTYPNFPTDLGQLINVLMTQIDGESTFKENIFSNRFSHVSELIKMGATIDVKDRVISVKGPTKLKAAEMDAYDLRGSASLVLASLTTRGLSTINNIEVLFRGYENIVEKITSLGGYIEVID